MSVNDSDLEFEERPQKQRQERKKLTGNNVGSWQRTNSSCSSVSSSHSRSDGRKKPTGDGKKTYEKPKGTNCELCGKQLSHMSQTAQLQHVNSCLDSMEELWDLEQKIQNWEEIVDCPICSKPLLPGPTKIAHLKSCGAAGKFSTAEMIKMLKLTEKVKEERKKAGLAHTTAPRPTEESVERKPKRNDWMPKSIIDENVQTALALSLSEKPFHFPNESDFPGSSSKVSKMPSKLPIGHQLASDEDANDLVSQRLANIIATETEPQRSPTSATKAEKSAPIKLYSLACLTDVKDGDVVGLRTTNDYLAVVVKEEETTEVASNVELAQWMWLRDDLKKFRKSKRNTGDVVLYCSDGTLSAHSIFLEVRTPGLWQSVRRGESELDAVLIDLSTWSKDVVESLLAYVYWAEVPTVQTITESLLKLARQFSIGRLELLCENLLRVDVVKTEDEEILAANEQQDEVRDVYNENWLKSTIKPCKIVLERLRVIAESNQSEDMCHASTADEDKCSSPVKIITPGVTPISSSLSTSGFRGEEKEDIERKLDRVRSSLGKIGNNPNISGSSRRSSSRRRSVSFTVAVSPAPVAVVDLTSTEDSDDDSLLLKIPLDNLSPYIPHSTRTTSKNGYTSTPKCVAAKKERSLMTKSRWTRMGNAGVKVVKTADLTPMPNYSAMGTPELTAALNENGVRKLSKKQGKKVLKEIYEATHPVIDISNSQDDTDTEEVAPAKRPKKRIKLVGAKEESVADSGNDSDSSEGSEQSKASLMEESIMPTDVEETTDSETNEKRPSISVLINQVRKFLRKDKNLHKKVLGFEPLPLKELHAAVKAAGINCSTANLMTVLDEMCVGFTAKDLRVKREKTKRPKKRQWNTLLNSKQIFKS